MDHARKLGKPERPTLWRRRRSPPCSLRDKPLLKDEEPIEDKRLANWQKWLNDRKKLCKDYGSLTNRDHRDLLINSPDTFRRKVEMKELMAITVGLANKKKPDKYRGNPGFWVTPEFLPKRCNPDLPDISITLTRKQLNLLPEIQQITLPELTQQEKGSLPQKEPIPLWERSVGGSTILEAKLSQELKAFGAKELEIKKLAVKGTRLGQKKSDSLKIPVITVTGANTFEDKDDRILQSEEAIILKIQDREISFIKAESKKELDRKSVGEITWSLIFKSSGLDVTEGAIRLENLGTSAITYQWRYGSLGTIVIPQTPRDSPFFFNKNKELILPGQVTVVRVWFRSSISRSATEFWTLITDPKVSREHLVFRFWGCCGSSPETSNIADEGFRINFNSIDRYLDRRIRDTEIQKIIHEILNNVQNKRASLPSYGSLFLEREIFEAKNPHFFYHSAVVHQLRDIYDKAASQDSPPWSLSLNELRRVLMQLNKPEVRNEAMVRFSELCRKSLEPSLYHPLGSTTKRSMVYTLLCSFVNKFEEESEYVRTESSRGPKADKMKSGTPNSSTIFKNSHQSSTPRINSKKIRRPPSRNTSNLSLSTTNTETVEHTSDRGPVAESLYKQVFYMRIRAIFVHTILEICGVVDTVNNLQDPGI